MHDRESVPPGKVADNQDKPRKQLIPRWVACIIVPVVILAVAAFLATPVVRTAREPARRSQCKNNLKQIGLALHNYAEDWGGLPPAYTVDVDGRKLHSWRTLILPYLGQQALYEQIDLTKPWDDPVNEHARKTVLSNCSCPSDIGREQHASYLALVGEDLTFHPTRSRPFVEFQDGLGTTIMLIEVPQRETFDWMEPRDADVKAFLHPKSPSFPHADGGHVLFADGKASFLKTTVDHQTRRGLTTINGGETLGKL